MALNRQELDQVIQSAVESKLASLRIESVEGFSGPIPHPDHCARYEKVLPGFTDRALKIAEIAQRDQAAASQRHDILGFTSRLMGQIFALTITLCFLGGGVFLFYHDKDGPAWASMVVGLASIGTAYLAFSRKMRG